MPVSRRMLLPGIGAAAAASAASAAVVPGAARACSLVARVRPTGLSDAACRRSLGRLVRVINEAPGLDDDAVARRAGELGVRFDNDVIDRILDYPARNSVEDLALIRGWTLSAGKRDRYYAEISETEASGDSCTVPSPAFFAVEDRSYLGVFVNNRLREVSAFDAWLREV